MTPLRRQMIRELELHRKAPDTVKSYVKAVEELARHDGRSPNQISKEEVRDFLHHAIVQRKLACSTVNHKLAAIQFFYRHVLGRQTNLRIPTKRSGRLSPSLNYPGRLPIGCRCWLVWTSPVARNVADRCTVNPCLALNIRD